MDRSQTRMCINMVSGKTNVVHAKISIGHFAGAADAQVYIRPLVDIAATSGKSLFQFGQLFWTDNHSSTPCNFGECVLGRKCNDKIALA